MQKGIYTLATKISAPKIARGNTSSSTTTVGGRKPFKKVERFEQSHQPLSVVDNFTGGKQAGRQTVLATTGHEGVAKTGNDGGR